MAAHAFTTFKHCHGSMLVSVDVETTGLEPGYHEIVQLAIIPMDSQLMPRKDIMPINILIKPQYVERWTHDIISKDRKKQTLETGLDSEKAKDVLEDWFIKLEIPLLNSGKEATMTALGQNYGFDKSFLMSWLGVENYSRYFHYHHRDTMIAANFLNDYADWNGEDIPFSRISLTALCNKLGITNEYKHDAYYDALVTIEVYRRMLQRGLA